MSRTQRCGNCEGCVAKACQVCVYCRDNPQYGGPGVKKQSCIARRCTRVLEGKLQRESTSLRAKTGCGFCEECRLPDCGLCLICMDKRVFGGKYMAHALCAKKKCTNARSLDGSPGRTPSPKQYAPHHQPLHYGGTPLTTKLKPPYDSYNGQSPSSNNNGLMSNCNLQLRKRLLGQDPGGGGAKKLRKATNDSSGSAGLSPYNQQLTHHNAAFGKLSGDGPGPGQGPTKAFFDSPSSTPTHLHSLYDNGSPPAGSVAAASSTIHSELNTYLQQNGSKNGQSSSSVSSHQDHPHHNHNHHHFVSNAYSSFPPLGGARPPYQWPPSRVLFPSVVNADPPSMTSSALTGGGSSISSLSSNSTEYNNLYNSNFSSSNFSEHPVLRDRLTSPAFAGSLLTANNLNNNNTNNNSLSYFYGSSLDEHDKFMQLYRNSNEKSIGYNNLNNNNQPSQPGSIITEPMGPMDQPKVILQQL